MVETDLCKDVDTTVSAFLLLSQPESHSKVRPTVTGLLPSLHTQNPYNVDVLKYTKHWLAICKPSHENTLLSILKVKKMTQTQQSNWLPIKLLQSLTLSGNQWLVYLANCSISKLDTCQLFFSPLSDRTDVLLILFYSYFYLFFTAAVCASHTASLFLPPSNHSCKNTIEQLFLVNRCSVMCSLVWFKISNLVQKLSVVKAISLIDHEVGLGAIYCITLCIKTLNPLRKVCSPYSEFVPLSELSGLL